MLISCTGSWWSLSCTCTEPSFRAGFGPDDGFEEIASGGGAPNHSERPRWRSEPTIRSTAACRGQGVFVPGLPHRMRIELRQALISYSYQDYHMFVAHSRRPGAGQAAGARGAARGHRRVRARDARRCARGPCSQRSARGLWHAAGPSRRTSAPRSVGRPLLMLQVNLRSCCRCGKGT